MITVLVPVFTLIEVTVKCLLLWLQSHANHIGWLGFRVLGLFLSCSGSGLPRARGRPETAWCGLHALLRALGQQ